MLSLPCEHRDCPAPPLERTHAVSLPAAHHRWLRLPFLSALLCPSDFVVRTAGSRGKRLDGSAGSPHSPALASLWGLQLLICKMGINLNSCLASQGELSGGHTEAFGKVSEVCKG